MTPLPRMAPLPRLSASTLHHAAKNVRLLGYDRAGLRSGIVHLGLGAFARAHLAEYTDDALVRAHGDWGITGVSLQRPDQRDRLAPQDGLYTALQRDGAGTQARIIGCVQAKEDLERAAIVLVGKGLKVLPQERFGATQRLE